MPWILALEDPASRYQLAWLPVEEATAEVVQATYARLFVEHTPVSYRATAPAVSGDRRATIREEYAVGKNALGRSWTEWSRAGDSAR